MQYLRSASYHIGASIGLFEIVLCYKLYIFTDQLQLNIIILSLTRSAQLKLNGNHYLFYVTV